MQAVITVSKPCNENWAAMPADGNGRYCAACAHTVVDFTHWELHDIAAYLKANAARRPCGRFRNTQLQKPFDLTVLADPIIHWNGNWWHKVAALIIVCFGLAVTSCNTTEGKKGKPLQSFIPELMNSGVINKDSFVISGTTDSLVEMLIAVPGTDISIGSPYDGGHTMGVPALEEEVVVVRPETPDTVIVNEKFIGPPEDHYSVGDHANLDSL